jgi:hypothetical protein
MPGALPGWRTVCPTPSAYSPRGPVAGVQRLDSDHFRPVSVLSAQVPGDRGPLLEPLPLALGEGERTDRVKSAGVPTAELCLYPVPR